MQQLKSPNGEAVISDRVMVLNEWAHYYLKATSTPKMMCKVIAMEQFARSLKVTSPQPMVFAGMGRPTYPVPISLASSLAGTAGILVSTSYNARAILELEEKTRLASDSITPFSRLTLDNVKNKNNGYASIEYRESSAGDMVPRLTMATALSENYKVKNLYSYEDIVFTNGGSAGLASIFKVINRKTPNGRIITPVPFYSLHAGDNRLHTIDLMKLPGYLLTAEALANAIASAKSAAALDGGQISAFLFCYPHNPTGTSLSEETLRSIAGIISKDESLNDIPIILDEAYAEMRMDGKPHVSLLTVAPELQNRIILLRSGTKAFSAAGERMAIVACKNKKWLKSIQGAHTDFNGHASYANSLAYAQAMAHFNDTEQKRLIEYYLPMVNLIKDGLASIGAYMPDPAYNPTGAFYVLADLGDLIGTAIHPDAVHALPNVTHIDNDESLIYHLLFSQQIMVAPLSYFGGDSKKGIIRITCSDIGDCEEIIKRLNKVLLEVRKEKCIKLAKDIKHSLKELSYIKTVETTAVKVLIASFNQNSEDLNLSFSLSENSTARTKVKGIKYNIPDLNAKQLKLAAEKLKAFSIDINSKILINASQEQDSELRGNREAGLMIAPLLRMKLTRNSTEEFKRIINIAWFKWVDLNVPERLRSSEKRLPFSKRGEDYPAWTALFTKLFDLAWEVDANNQLVPKNYSESDAINMVISEQIKLKLLPVVAEDKELAKQFSLLINALKLNDPSLLTEQCFFKQPRTPDEKSKAKERMQTIKSTISTTLSRQSDSTADNSESSASTSTSNEHDDSSEESQSNKSSPKKKTTTLTFHHAEQKPFNSQFK